MIRPQMSPFQKIEHHGYNMRTILAVLGHLEELEDRLNYSNRNSTSNKATLHINNILTTLKSFELSFILQPTFNMMAIFLQTHLSSAYHISDRSLISNGSRLTLFISRMTLCFKSSIDCHICRGTSAWKLLLE